MSKTNRERSIEIITEMAVLMKEFGEVQRSTSKDNDELRSAIVLGIDIPDANFGLTSMAGNNHLCDGILKNLVEAKKEIYKNREKNRKK